MLKKKLCFFGGALPHFVVINFDRRGIRRLCTVYPDSARVCIQVTVEIKHVSPYIRYNVQKMTSMSLTLFRLGGGHMAHRILNWNFRACILQMTP